MSKKILVVFGIIACIFALISIEFILIRNLKCPETDTLDSTTKANDIPQAMMVLIEFKQPEGLVNMVNDMKEREIHGLLMLTPDFAEQNVDIIKQILDIGNVEVIATYVEKPFWNIPYEEQYETIRNMVDRIEKAIDTDIRIIGSRYMASDENTIKAAEELGIEYVTARGTTDLALTVYKPEEYDVKILSVSNIDTPEFKYGSLCDYSYYERAGTPDDMIRDLERAAEEEKFVGVSHTYIGGYKERWNNMWHQFWDNNAIKWVDLDTLGQIDKELPIWQIPVNINAPYTPEKIRPLIPYDEEKNVENPCSVEDL